MFRLINIILCIICVGIRKKIIFEFPLIFIDYNYSKHKFENCIINTLCYMFHYKKKYFKHIMKFSITLALRYTQVGILSS